MKKEQTSNNPSYESRYADVLDSKIHYIEQGQGNPILFLHGMPTSSYIWRNIIPHVSKLGRCIAPDLIGMGKSGKPNSDYSIENHINYIEKFIEALNLKNITLVMHGWGSVIGFHYAMKNEKNCRGLVFYEAYLREVSGDSLSLPMQEQISELEEDTFDIIINGSKFIDQVLPQSMVSSLSQQDMSHYREPFVSEGTGKPLQQYLLELPRGNGKSKADKIISAYSRKLTQSYLPKLLLYSIPGFITTIATVMWAKEHLHNLEIAEVGEDLHYAQESNPFLMGETISIWLQGIEQMV
jgi:haloalkane dehalogenase